MPEIENNNITHPEGLTEREALAQVRVDPFFRHGVLVNNLTAQTVNGGDVKCNSGEVGEAMRAVADRVAAGDLRAVTDALLSQSMMLDTAATEMMMRAWRNVGKYPEAFRSYMGLAFKAQAQSRAALEAAAKIHQPREQIVRHVHVYEGGQAVVAEQLHMHGPGVRNERHVDQSHATGAGASSECTTLPGSNAVREGVSASSGSGEASVSNARRNKPRRAARK